MSVLYDYRRAQSLGPFEEINNRYTWALSADRLSTQRSRRALSVGPCGPYLDSVRKGYYHYISPPSYVGYYPLPSYHRFYAPRYRSSYSLSLKDGIYHEYPMRYYDRFYYRRPYYPSYRWKSPNVYSYSSPLDLYVYRNRDDFGRFPSFYSSSSADQFRRLCAARDLSRTEPFKYNYASYDKDLDVYETYRNAARNRLLSGLGYYDFYGYTPYWFRVPLKYWR
ncbi:hypothetical protein ACOME3_003150 [Neoechinorhynchus agilis]